MIVNKKKIELKNSLILDGLPSTTIRGLIFNNIFSTRRILYIIVLKMNQ